jgi:formylglycine-generating enzyme required for sulfatase activity
MSISLVYLRTAYILVGVQEIELHLGFRAIVYVFAFWFLATIQCCRQFDNPIDPDNSEAIPPSPQNLRVSTVPYDDSRVLRGQFEFTWQNSSGVQVERLAPGQNTFNILDTLYAPSIDFSDQLPANDGTEYRYRLRAFNQNGLSKPSNVAGTAGEDSLDLFPPNVNPWHENNPLTRLKTIQDSILVIRFKVIDESPIASFTVNGVEVQEISSDGKWYTFIDTLQNWSNPYVWKAIDQSEDSRFSTDTLIIFYDAYNQEPLVHFEETPSGVQLKWKSTIKRDFSLYKIQVLSEGGLSEETTTDPLDTVWRWEGNKSADVSFTVSLTDSAGNEVFGPNSTIQRKAGIYRRNKSVWIKPGSFTDDISRTASITKGFWMDSTEVTQLDFVETMGYNPSVFGGDLKPVEAVSWFDAIRFCNARSKREGFDTVYSWTRINGPTISNLEINQENVGYRLPSEDEWELAARAGLNQDPFLWGETFSHDTVSEFAWYSKNAGADIFEPPFANEVGPQTVAWLLPNNYGLYDMSGNLDEWTQDYYGSDDESRLSGRQDYLGPNECLDACVLSADLGAQDEYQRILKGGSWNMNVFDLALSSRRPQGQSLRTRSAGLRPIIQGWD